MKRNAPSRRNALQQLFETEGAAPRIKLCGMTRAIDIEMTNQAQSEFCGFIINVAKSKRTITPQQQAELVSLLDPSIFAIGVLVDEPLTSAIALAESGHFDALQLHGHEDAAYLKELKRHSSVPLIQAFQMNGAFDRTRLSSSMADMILLDSGSGSGKTFDWESIPQGTRPFFLAGGLTPDNIAQAIAQVNPWGVDLSSGLETDGHKDEHKIHAAIHAVRSN